MADEVGNVSDPPEDVSLAEKKICLASTPRFPTHILQNIQITITILDRNDNEPVFSPGGCRVAAAVPEDAPEGEEV